MKKLTVTALALATLAGAAHAQCTINRYGVPDFDQKRNALPNDGKMYCVPTSFTNLRGYIANHGYGNIMSGPRNWQSSGNYNYVTARIDAIGDYMDTDPFGGTNGGDAYDGWVDFIDDWHDDKFSLSMWSGYIPPIWIHFGMLTGLTNICYGYYKPQGGGVYDRDGGHCVTLVGLKGLCANFNEPTLRIRNPSSGDSINSQSTFSTEETRTDLQGFNYDGDWSTRHRLIDFGAGSSTRRYLDKLYVIHPQICLTGGVSRSDDIQIHRPVKLFGITPESSSHESPSPSFDVAQVALHPMGAEAFVLKHNPDTRQWRLYRQNLTTNEWTTVLPTFLAERSHMAISRFGHLFVYADGSVKKYDLGHGSFPLLATIATPAPFVDMEYDDKLDEIVAITTTNRFLRYDQGLLLPAKNEPFPTGVAVVGDGSVYPDPTGASRWYIASSGSPVLYRVVPNSPGVDRLRIESVITLPPDTEPRSLVMTDSGHLVFSDRGQIADWKFTDFGTHAAWAPDDTSAIAGLPVGRTLVVNRSRNNMVAGIHDQPKWQDDSYENEGVAEVADCNPDLNVDGEVDILDFLAFFDSFGVCQGDDGPCGVAGINADYNTDGIVDILDMLDFLNDFGNGCA